MPVHDWTRVDAGIFHAFHHGWIEEISRALNRGILESDYYALPEQISGNYGPDVLTLKRPGLNLPPRKDSSNPTSGGGMAVAMPLPQTRIHVKDVPKWYANKKKSVAVHHITDHRVVAVLEIVSSGNKDSRGSLRSFVKKAQDLLSAGIHLDILDLYPPTPRDPEGIHPVIWGEDDAGEYKFDPTHPLTCAAYVGGADAQAFVEPVAVGDVLPDLPLFLLSDQYVKVPLESTYLRAFEALPAFLCDELNTTISH